MTISPPSALLGVQEPRLRNVPPRADLTATSGDFAIDLAATAGLFLDPWQQLVLREALGERPDGKWAAFEVCLIVPRQCGKGSVLEALELAMLVGADEGAPPPLILHSAHEFKTSAEHFRRMRDLVEGSDSLRRKIRIVRTAAGSESIELHSGARLRFVTRTGGSGRGFSADTIVIDEAYNLTAESMAAVLPTMSARPNPQVWYTSSAGLPASSQLARLRERGLQGSERLAFFEWSAPDGADLDDLQVWAQANPALGIRIPVDFVAAEREAMPDEQFARERLGIWQPEGGATAVDLNVWAALADPSAERGMSPCFGIASAPDRSWSAISVAWRRPDGLVQVMLADYRPGDAWLEARKTELLETWGGSVAVSLKGLAGEAKAADAAVAHNAFASLMDGRDLRHGNEPALNMAVRSARWRPQGDTRVLDRKGSADISPLDAAALAAHAVSIAPEPDPGLYVI